MDSSLNRHPAILSIREDGFLSVAIERTIPALREKHAAWFDFAGRVNKVGQRIMNSAERRCVGLTTHDPICVATRLLIRTLSGFQALVLLAERGMTLEADAMVRGLYENSLWLGFLNADADAALKALLVDELFSQRGRDRSLLAQLERADHADDQLRAALKGRVAAADTELRGKKRLGIEDLAAKGGFEDFYMFYKRLSSGSAHPSFHSLAQHLDMNPDGTWSGHVTGPDAEGIETSLNLGSHALLSCLAVFNGVWPGGDGAGDVMGLLEAHLRLAGVDAEPADG